MNSDEILQIIGKSNFAIGLGGYNHDDFDNDCEIYNLLIFDGKNKSDEIIQHESKIFKISHENLSESNSENLINFSNIQIINDEQWDLKILLSKIEERKNSLFQTSAKNALVDSQLAISKAKHSLENNDPFVSCWTKCSSLFLIDSILLENQLLPRPTQALSYLRNLEQKNTNQFIDKIIFEIGTERVTPSLLSRMLKSTIGFSDMIEQNHNSMIIEKKANHLIQNSLLSDCYLYLSYQNRNNFYKIQDSLNKNSDKIHVLKIAFDLSNAISESSQSINSLSEITKSLLNHYH
tara:strand:- start:525 stop:1403 length:879 start_codon:yes stop_codon:yes gene_type:complete